MFESPQGCTAGVVEEYQHIRCVRERTRIVTERRLHMSVRPTVPNTATAMASRANPHQRRLAAGVLSHLGRFDPVGGCERGSLAER